MAGVVSGVGAAMAVAGAVCTAVAAAAATTTGVDVDVRVAGTNIVVAGTVVVTRSVVVATGTFLRGKLYTGSETTPGGRKGSPPAVRLAASLEEAGLPLMRLKTGTCPRLDGSTINYNE